MQAIIGIKSLIASQKPFWNNERKMSFTDWLLHRHKSFILSLLVVVFLSGVGFGLSYYLVSQQIKTYFLQIFEQKSLSQLQVYHEGEVKLTDEFLTGNLRFINTLARDESITRSFLTNDLTAVEKSLSQVKTMYRKFESLFVLDKKGKMTTIVSDLDLRNLIGQDLSYRDYFKNPVATKEPFVSAVLSGISGRDVVIFSAPVLDTNSNVLSVLCGSVAVSKLPEKLTLGSEFVDLSSILVDSSGNILLEDQKSPKERINIKDKSTMFQTLALGGKGDPLENINYKGKRVFVEGTTLQVGKQQFYIISYYPKAEFDRQVKGLDKEILRVYTFVFLIGTGLTLIALIAIVWLMYKHEIKESA